MDNNGPPVVGIVVLGVLISVLFIIAMFFLGEAFVTNETGEASSTPVLDSSPRPQPRPALSE